MGFMFEHLRAVEFYVLFCISSVFFNFTNSQWVTFCMENCKAILWQFGFNVLGASSYSKTPTTDKLDRWAESTVEISLRPVNALCRVLRFLLHIGLGWSTQWHRHVAMIFIFAEGSFVHTRHPPPPPSSSSFLYFLTIFPLFVLIHENVVRYQLTKMMYQLIKFY